MEYNEFSGQIESSYDEHKEHGKIIKEAHSMDRGYNVIYRTCPNKKGQQVRTPISIYTSGGTDSQIRDAESGAYYSHLVGSADEDLYFKVILATGECKSKNGSSTLFYSSPRHYMSHLNNEVSEDTLQMWESKRAARSKAREMKKNNALAIIVN
jgi:hypothetical protein